MRRFKWFAYPKTKQEAMHNVRYVNNNDAGNIIHIIFNLDIAVIPFAHGYGTPYSGCENFPVAV